MSGIFTKCLVRAPPPGPTSSKFLKGCCIKAAIILPTTFSSFKKCWPRDFLSVCMVCKLVISLLVNSLIGKIRFRIICLFTVSSIFTLMNSEIILNQKIIYSFLICINLKFETLCNYWNYIKFIQFPNIFYWKKQQKYVMNLLMET